MARTAACGDPSNVGIAPRVSLIGLKVLDSKGAGYTSDVIRAIEFAVANRSTLGIDIINLSLGHVPYESANTDPLVRAVDKASAAGIVVVVAAGNVGISPVTGSAGLRRHPLAGQFAFGDHGGLRSTRWARARAQTTSSDRTARAGRRGLTDTPSPISVAPGHKLLAPVDSDSDLPRSNPSLKSGSLYGPTYLTLTGTSMAAAVTSGVVALVLEANEAALRGRPSRR